MMGDESGAVCMVVIPGISGGSASYAQFVGSSGNGFGTEVLSGSVRQPRVMVSSSSRKSGIAIPQGRPAVLTYAAKRTNDGSLRAAGCDREIWSEKNTISGNSQLSITTIGHSYSSGFSHPAQSFSLIAWWNMALWDVGVLRELADAPWQILRAQPRRIFFDLGAASPLPTLSLPGVTDIGTTSARPRVTVTY